MGSFDGSKRLLRVAPGTAYTAGNDIGGADGAFDLSEDGTVRVTCAFADAGDFYFRVGSQNLTMNAAETDPDLAAAGFYSFEMGVNADDAFSFRFENSTTIRYFFVQFYKQR